jgi:diaminohydroxyphosphoribosylaminopyrimidine deaminase / 5-amino-6-(5-phosphoribosylamino)uracil reductase
VSPPHAASAATAERDSTYMRRALALAALGWGQTAPNPMVGAVVVAPSSGAPIGIVVGEGFHARYGGPHAEPVALAAAGARARDATLYVTLEPCAHHGRTPPCADAIIAARVARVVAAVHDPSAVARGGAEKLRAAGIQVDFGPEHDAAVELNAPFFNAQASELPWVTLKLALSADDAVADPTGERRWISNAESRARGHRLRANADAIAVGIGTVLADDPTLTVRDAPAPRLPPRRVVFDSALRTPVKSMLVRTARDIPTTIVVGDEGARSPHRASLEHEGVDLIVAPSANAARSGATDLRAALETLRDRGVRSLLVEAGPRLAGEFLAASLVQRVVIFRAPFALGGSAPRAFAFAPPGFAKRLDRAPIVDRQQLGDDVMTSYALEDVPCSPD